MSIILTFDSTSLELHPDLYWEDEHSWHPVEQTATRTITGGLIVQTAERLDGRPITLEPIDDSSAWLPWLSLSQLRNWAAVAGNIGTLTLRGTTYTVMFRHQDGNAVEAEPVVFYNTVDNGDFYRVTIRLMEVTT